MSEAINGCWSVKDANHSVSC